MIITIDGFNPLVDELKEGELVYYLTGHSPNLQLRVGRYVPAKDENGDVATSCSYNGKTPKISWHVVDIETGKKKYPYTSEICPLKDFKASYVTTQLVKCDRRGNLV